MECKTCRWWERLTSYNGRCHRYPPQVTEESDSQPSTEPTDYCGEYAQAPADPAASDA
jgi:hypothetical protein